MILSKELIFAAKTSCGGFTKAQIEFLGFVFGEEWIGQCEGMNISEQEYATFVSYRDVDAKQLKQLKANKLFAPISSKIVYDLDRHGVYTGVNHQDGSPICVGDTVEFEWNETIGKVKAKVRFDAPSFVGVVIECSAFPNLIGAKTPVSFLWKKALT